MSNVRSIYSDRDPREVPLYTVRQAAIYLGVPPTTMRAWTVGQDYPKPRTGRFKPLLALPAGKPAMLTFNNLIEAYVITQITRGDGENDPRVELAKVRRAIGNVQRRLGSPRPLLTEEFRVAGVDLYLQDMGKLYAIAEEDGRQLVLREVIDSYLRRIDRDPSGLAMRLYPYARRANEPKVVAIDPVMSFGRPTMRESGVAVSIVADLVHAGESPERVAEEFGFRAADVTAAVEWADLRAAA